MDPERSTPLIAHDPGAGIGFAALGKLDRRGVGLVHVARHFEDPDAFHVFQGLQALRTSAVRQTRDTVLERPPVVLVHRDLLAGSIR